MEEFVRELKESAAGLHDGMGGHADHCAMLMEKMAKRIEAMARICAGMTLEEMQNAAFDYKSLVEIVQRRDVRNACVPDERTHIFLDGRDDRYKIGYADGWNACRREMISKIGEQK